MRQRVDDVKTVNSERLMSIDGELLTVLKTWKQTTQFSANEDWMFASPTKLGRQPWSYDQVLRSFLKAGADAGIGRLGTPTMRHADIRTTMNTYGDVVTDEMSLASGKVARLALTDRSDPISTS